MQSFDVLTDLPGEGKADDSTEHEGHEELRHVGEVGARCLAYL